jgi:hypothetical protein
VDVSIDLRIGCYPHPMWKSKEKGEAMNDAFKCTHATSVPVVLVLSFLFALSGCVSSKSRPTAANFTAGLNKHFLEHSDCLLDNIRFPFEASERDKTKQMDSLVKAQLLEKTEEMSIHVSRYTVTPTGTRYAPRFCYGHREVTSIDSFTPPAVANGFTETSVVYHYVMNDVPVWAKTPEVEAAFPDMAKATSGQATGKATLAQTPVGWQVPD